MRAAFLYAGGRAARLPLVRAASAPTEFFYGAIELAAQGWETAHFELDGLTPSLFARGVAAVVPRSILPVKTDVSLVARVGQLCGRLNEFDGVVATTGNLAFAAAFWAKAGSLRPPVIGIHCGTLDYHHSWWRRQGSAALLRRTQTMLFGDAEQEPFQRFFALPPESVTVNHFGVDTAFWHSAVSPGKGGYVLAVGNDGRRDYATLLAAAAKIAAPIRIVTQRQLPTPLPPNVTVVSGSWHGAELSDEELRALYQGASCVVVPIVKTFQPSGQSVTLQAMACGCPVVLTDFPGLWSEEQLQEGRNVLLARLGDAHDLAEKINQLLGDTHRGAVLGAAASAMVREQATIAGYARRLGTLLAALRRR